jgi:hypothetical protein
VNCWSRFTSNASSLRIDRLVATSVAEGKDGPAEYRLCATWRVPDNADPLTTYLVPMVAQPTVAGTRTATFCVNADAVWRKRRLQAVLRTVPLAHDDR